jgi:hypothetical protein
MASLGSQQRPVIVKVTSEKMAKKVAKICEEHVFNLLPDLRLWRT